MTDDGSVTREVVAVAVAVARAARTLAAAGVASPRADAELLAAHVLGVPRGRLALVAGLAPAQLTRFEQLVARRAARVPLQHLTGTAAFGRLELAVGPGVFVPRPETELLAEWAVSVPAGIVVDLCSGTGALALAIAHGRPGARVYAVERAPAARSWLRRNAADRAAAGDTPIEVVAGDATDPAVLAGLDGTVDLVVCNPPYVPATAPVPPEVADHDPPEAVFAGPDGLAVIRPVVGRAAALLRPGGWLGLEHDEAHAAAVGELLRRWFTRIVDHDDLAGRPRYVTARRVAD
jgi:release factor glutamine methyltransferase